MTTADTRRFRVHARHEDVRHGRLVSESTFEAAAIAYVEHLAIADPHQAVAVVVHDLDSAQEHSFVIHLDTGETKATS